MPRSLFDLRLLLVLGKGGVGRTTVSAAMALAAAREGRRVLVAMCNAKERLSHLLEVDAIDERNRPILPNIEAVNMTPEAALEEYGMMILKVRALYRAVFQNRFVASFLRGTPGIDAWAMLGKAYFHTLESDSSGRPRYDLVILDAPATGHALDMLRVPKVLVDAAPPGLLRTEAEKAIALFRDEGKTGAVLVALPEDMPTNETLELHRALRDELGISVARLVMNSMVQRFFEPDEREVFRELGQQLKPDSPLLPYALTARARVLREQLQDESVARLSSAIPAPRIELPHLFQDDLRRSAVDSLSQVFR